MKDVSAMGNEFRKKPGVVKAVKFTGDNGGEMREFVGSALSWNPLRNEAHIATEEGIMRANAGDWIIKGVKGEFYPCKPDIFAANYEPANVPIPPGPRPQLYVISVTGDGGQTTIVPEDKLKQALHDNYCACGKEWNKCNDEVITNTVAKLDDDEEWAKNYPDYERHIWLDRGEDYTVQVMRVSSAFPVAAPSAQTPHSVKDWRTLIMKEVVDWSEDMEDPRAYVDFCAEMLAKYAPPASLGMEQVDVERLAEIRERESKATKGPWKVYPSNDPSMSVISGKDWFKFAEVVTRMHAAKEDNPVGVANAAFMAHARADIPYLLEALASERSSAIKEAREECARAVCILCFNNVPLRNSKFHTFIDDHKADIEILHERARCQAHMIRALGER
jgi:hypothetical protein